jgi:sugar phosphate isomerase/epimerase
MELVLFEAGEKSNLPGSRELEEIKKVARSNNLTFSVHFPIDRKAGAKSEQERNEFCTYVIEIIEITKKLPLTGYVLHLEGLENEHDRAELTRWMNAVDSVCARILRSAAVNPSLICLENLDYSPHLNYEISLKYGFSHCIDFGHLWLYGHDWKNWVLRRLGTAGILHLHGVHGGKDHRSLAAHDEYEQLQELTSMIKRYKRVITLEVFGKEETFKSLEHFGELWRKSL